MRVVFVSDHFSTPEEPGILRTWQIAKHLADEGDEVAVIAPGSHYLFGEPATAGAKAAVPEGVRVIRMRTSRLRRGTARSRLRHYAGQMALSAVATWRAGPCDVVVAGLTPSMLSIGVFWAARLRGIPFVIDERDLALDAARQARLLPMPVVRAAQVVERFLHARSARVITVTPGLRSLLLKRGLASQKVVLAPNGYDGLTAEALGPDRRNLRERVGWAGRTVVLYAGGLGHMYDLDLLLDAVARLDRDRFLVVIMGEGERKDHYVRRSEREELPVSFPVPVSKAELAQFCRAADVCVIPLRGLPWAEMAVPNKLFDYLGAGRPVVVTGPGDAADLVESAGAGLAVAAGDPVTFARALAALDADPAAAEQMGVAGREFVLRSWTRAASVRTFRAALLAAAKGGRPAGPGRRRASAGWILAVVPVDCRFEHMAVNQRLRALLEIAEVDIIASYPKSFPEDISRRGHIRGLPMSSRISYTATRRLVFSVEATVWGMMQRLCRHRYRMVYAMQDASAATGLLLRGSGTRFIVDVLDDPLLEMRNMQQQGNWSKARALRLRDCLIRRLLRRADLVTTIGTSENDLLPVLLRQRYGVDPGRLLPLRQAIDMKRIVAAVPPTRLDHGSRVIFYVGWVSAARGIDTLIAAIDLLRSRGEQVELRLAGWEDSDAGLRANIENRSYVSYLGLLSSAVVRDEIVNAEICCCPFPDREELAPVQPVKVLEYLALGRPTVGSSTHGISAIIEDGQSGLLAQPGSADSFARAFERILHDDELAARLAEGARKRAAAFDVSLVNKNLQQRVRAWL
jgi:colanic acid biosynthesis glycosyl transferase WcaI